MKILYKNKLINDLTSDYLDAINKPKINDVELVGNMTTEDAKITWFGTQTQYDAISTKNPNTIYIIDDGTASVTTNNYLDLNNKPSINGVQLTGDKTPADLNLYTKSQIDTMFSATKAVEVVPSKPVAPIAGTVYYVGPNSEGVYHIYVYDSTGVEIDMGTTRGEVYHAGVGLSLNLNTFSVKYDPNSISVNSDNELYVPVFKGATSTTDGIRGLVPTPMAGDQNKFLCGDGNWKDVLDLIYPVGSVFISIDGLRLPDFGTWVQLATGRCLWNTLTGGGGNIEAALPLPEFEQPATHTHTVVASGNHNHTFNAIYGSTAGETLRQWVAAGGGVYVGQKSLVTDPNGVHTHVTEGGGTYTPVAAETSVYKASATTVQPPAIAVTMWKRTA